MPLAGCSLAATEGTTMRRSPALGLCLLLVAGQTAWAQAPVVRLGKPQAITTTQTSNYSPAAERSSAPSLYPNLLQADYEPGNGQGGIIQTQAPEFPPPAGGPIPSTPPIGVPTAGADPYNCGVVTQNPANPTGVWEGVQQWAKGFTNGFEGNG